MVIAIITGVTAGTDTRSLKADGQGLKTRHKILNDRSVVFGQSEKHVTGSVAERLKVLFCFQRSNVCRIADDLLNRSVQGVSARVHQPAAGPMKRTVTQNRIIAPIPIQAPRVVVETNALVCCCVRGNQETILGDVSFD